MALVVGVTKAEQVAAVGGGAAADWQTAPILLRVGTAKLKAPGRRLPGEVLGLRDSRLQRPRCRPRPWCSTVPEGHCLAVIRFSIAVELQPIKWRRTRHTRDWGVSLARSIWSES